MVATKRVGYRERGWEFAGRGKEDSGKEEKKEWVEGVLVLGGVCVLWVWW